MPDNEQITDLDNTHWQVRYEWDNGRLETESVSFYEVRGTVHDKRIVPTDAAGNNLFAKNPTADRIKLVKP